MSKNFVSFLTVSFVALALVSPNILLADDARVVDAEAQTDLLVEELVSAVSTVTADVTPENAADLSAAVSALLAGSNDYRLIGTEGPLGADSAVMDRFERRALRRAVRTGQMTQKVRRGELRTVVPLTFSLSDASANCAVCHGNYPSLVDSPDDIVVVGAASFRVAIDDEDDDEDDDDDEDEDDEDEDED